MSATKKTSATKSKRHARRNRTKAYPKPIRNLDQAAVDALVPVFFKVAA